MCWFKISRLIKFKINKKYLIKELKIVNAYTLKIIILLYITRNKWAKIMINDEKRYVCEYVYLFVCLLHCKSERFPQLTCSSVLWEFASISLATSSKRLANSPSRSPDPSLWNSLNNISSKEDRTSEYSTERLLLGLVSGTVPAVLTHPAAEGSRGILQILAKVQRSRHEPDTRSSTVVADLRLRNSCPSLSWVFSSHSTMTRFVISTSCIPARAVRSSLSAFSPSPQVHPTWPSCGPAKSEPPLDSSISCRTKENINVKYIS